MEYIITGCAGAGKTTLINRLSSMGYHCIPEISRVVIREELLKRSRAVPWGDTKAFCQLVFKKMLSQQRPEKDLLSFSDRGLPDVIAYLKAVKLPIPPIYVEAMQQFNYAEKVFILEPCPQIYENDFERRETYEQARFFYHAVRETYMKMGFDLIVVPFGHVEWRAEYLTALL